MYTSHFNLADDLVSHLDGVLSEVTDPFLLSRYAGFVAVSAATVFELAVKSILIDFAAAQHPVLSNFVGRVFERLNGRVSLQALKEEHLPKFGAAYVAKFSSKLEETELAILRSEGESVKSSYGNLLQWRHGFAHGGLLPATATYAEVCRSYHSGKHVLHSLAFTMT